MNKTDLIQKVAESTGDSAACVERVINTSIAAISNELRAGNSVAINGFLKLDVKTQAARTGRNPKTGEALTIPEKTVVKSKVSPSILRSA